MSDNGLWSVGLLWSLAPGEGPAFMEHFPGGASSRFNPTLRRHYNFFTSVQSPKVMVIGIWRGGVGGGGRRPCPSRPTWGPIYRVVLYFPIVNVLNNRQ